MGEFGAYKGKGQTHWHDSRTACRYCSSFHIQLSLHSSSYLQYFNVRHGQSPCKWRHLCAVLITTLSPPMSIPTAIIQSSWTAQSYTSQKNKVISPSRTQSKNVITFRLKNHVIVSGVDKKKLNTVNNSFQGKFYSVKALISHPCSGCKHTSKYWSFLLK